MVICLKIKYKPRICVDLIIYLFMPEIKICFEISWTFVLKIMKKL